MSPSPRRSRCTAWSLHARSPLERLATEPTTPRSAAAEAQGVTGYAWNETATDIQLDVRESGYKWSKQILQPYGGEGEFTGHDKGNARRCIR